MAKSVSSHGRTHVAILTPFPAPYRVPLFNALAEQTDIDVTVMISEMKGVPNQKWQSEPSDWRFPYRLLPSIAIRYEAPNFGSAYYPLNLTLPFELAQRRYDVVVALGWPMLYSNLALLMGKVLRTPTILWETSIPHPPSKLKRRLEPIIRRLISAYDAWLVASTLCGQYLMSYGAVAERVFLMPQVVDFAFYQKSARALAGRRAELRTRYGIQTPHVLCFVGQLIQRKGIRVLIEAMSQLGDLRCDVCLLIVGIGPLEGELKAQCRMLGFDESRVRFLGYVPQSRLPEVYAVSDAFVLPSYYDTFGAAVLEAMASGLPVILTNGVGAAYDLVNDGVNGFVVPVGSVEHLRRAIARTLEAAELRERMASASEVVLKGWNLTRAVNSFSDAIGSVATVRQWPTPMR